MNLDLQESNLAGANDIKIVVPPGNTPWEGRMCSPF